MASRATKRPATAAQAIVVARCIQKKRLQGRKNCCVRRANLENQERRTSSDESEQREFFGESNRWQEFCEVNRYRSKSNHSSRDYLGTGDKPSFPLSG
jgi:hypothetical protein